MNPRFYFTTCQTGAEKAVKAEVLASYPQLRFAFSRPGFITFKEENSEKPPLESGRWIFSRIWGVVIDQTRDIQQLDALLSKIPAGETVQCFDRDQFVPGEEPAAFEHDANIRSILKDRQALLQNGIPVTGSTVYDLVWVDDFHVFLGSHTHTEKLSPFPGNIPEIPLPDSAPSRAYLKIEEAFYRFKTVTERGQSVLEIGCAPGGATSAMLARGLNVTGVDPQFMDERIYKLPGFTHIRKPARFLSEEDLGKINPDWLVMDMSIAPVEAVTELAHAISLLRKMYGKELKIRQGFLTLKLNDWKFAPEIPAYLKRLEQIGFHSLHPVQLCSNRQEFFVWSARFK